MDRRGLIVAVAVFVCLSPVVAGVSSAAARSGNLVVTISTPKGVPATVALVGPSKRLAIKAARGTKHTQEVRLAPGRYVVKPELTTFRNRLYAATVERRSVVVQADRTTKVSIRFAVVPSASALHATNITPTSISLAWAAPRGATVELRRTVGNRPTTRRSGGVRVAVGDGSAVDLHLHTATPYAYALFTRMHRHWLPAITDVAVTQGYASIDEYVVGSDLNCQMSDHSDGAGEFFGGSACGTFVDLKGVTHGPALADIPNGDNLDNETYRPWHATAQTTSGSGTAVDPYVITTSATATPTLSISQTDSYVPGDSDVSTTTTVTNTSDSDRTITLYHAFDCFPGGSDTGTGAADTATGSVSCLSHNVSDEGRRTLQLAPNTSGSHYVEEFYQDLWRDIAAQNDFTDRVRTDVHDTSEGLSWDLTVPAGGSKSVQYTTSLLNSY